MNHFTIFLLFLLAYSNAFASFGTFVNYDNGEYSYQLDISEQELDQSSNGNGAVRSLLTYPLDMPLLGIIWQTALGRDILQIKISAMDGSTSEFIDEDWLGATNGSKSAYYKFSYTESQQQLFQLNVELSWGAFDEYKVEPDYPITWVFQFHQLEFDEFGYKGWNQFGGERIPISGNDDQLCLKYTLTTAEIGIKVKKGLSGEKRMGLNASLYFSPLAFAFDYDQHLLRLKEHKTSFYGIHVSPSLNAFAPANDNTLLFISVSYIYKYMWGDSKQLFIGDDPFTPENETGESMQVNGTLIQDSFSINAGIMWGI